MSMRASSRHLSRTSAGCERGKDRGIGPVLVRNLAVQVYTDALEQFCPSVVDHFGVGQIAVCPVAHVCATDCHDEQATLTQGQDMLHDLLRVQVTHQSTTAFTLFVATCFLFVVMTVCDRAPAYACLHGMAHWAFQIIVGKAHTSTLLKVNTPD